MDYLLEVELTVPAEPAPAPRQDDIDTEMWSMNTATSPRRAGSLKDQIGLPDEDFSVEVPEADFLGRDEAREDMALSERMEAAAQNAVQGVEPILTEVALAEGPHRMRKFHSAVEQAKHRAADELFSGLLDKVEYNGDRTFKQAPVYGLAAALFDAHILNPKVVTGLDGEKVIEKAMQLANAADEEGVYTVAMSESGRATDYDGVANGPGLGRNHTMSMKAYSNKAQTMDIRLKEVKLRDPRNDFLAGLSSVESELSQAKSMVLLLSREDRDETHGKVIRYQLRVMATSKIIEHLRAVKDSDVTEETTEGGHTIVGTRIELADGTNLSVKYLTSQQRFFLNVDTSRRPFRQVAVLPMPHPDEIKFLDGAVRRTAERRLAEIGRAIKRSKRD